VLNNSGFEEATLTHLADHITMVKRRILAKQNIKKLTSSYAKLTVYSHISKEKICINNNRRKQSPNQCFFFLFFSFVTCSITYCAYQTFSIKHKGSNLFVFGCEAYTGGKSFLSCRQKLLILF